MLSNPVEKDSLEQFTEMKSVFQKIIVSVMEIHKVAIITMEMIGFKKPVTGTPASQINKVLNKRSKRDLARNSLILNQDLV